MSLDRGRLSALLAGEERRFHEAHPRSFALYGRARRSLLGGVPMHWMVRWAGGFPIFVTGGEGAYLTDVDGHRYLDLCLGDTGAMTGHSPAATVEAVRAQAGRGFTFMLPTEDAVWVGEELARRFGLPYWQFAVTATDANRFALRLAREITGRPKILVFNWCYHGTVDETFVTLRDGRPVARDGNLGPPVDPSLTTRVVEFNDLPALESALGEGDVACVLAEPALTNVGIVHPEPGFHAALRDLTRRTGTLLVIDETHTICAGPGGYTRAHGLEPDLLTLGKPVAGGVPGAVYGLSEAVADRIQARVRRDTADTGGVGGTLAGNALATAAMRATLEHVLTEASYGRTIPLAERFARGVEAVIAQECLPWIVKRLGCRVEYWFRPVPPRNGGEAAAAVDPDLERYMHLAALNRGILLTPFHNMALLAPAVTEADVDRHTEVFRESVQAGEALPLIERCLWTETLPAVEAPRTTGEAGTVPARTDVAIIGGGYTGLAAARSLARHGAGVTVLERHAIGWGASSRNGGFVLPGYKPEIEALARKLGAAEARRLFELSVQAVRGLEVMIGEESIDCAYARCGTVVLAARPGHLAELERSRRFLQRELAHETELLGPSEVRAEIGSTRYHGGLLDPFAGSVQPAALVYGLARAAERAGARLVPGAEVRRVDRAGEGFVVSTAAGDIRAREVLVATNAYTGAVVPALRRRVVPVGSYLIATAPLDAALARRLVPRRRVLSDTKNLLYYFRVAPDGRMVFGGRAAFTPTPLARTAAILARGMREVFPELADAPVEYAWGGKVAFTVDRMPHAGRLDGIHYALGYAGHGVAMATWLGARMGDALAGAGEVPRLTSRFPAVPLYRGTPWFLPLVGGYYRVRDWLGR